jgi:integrase
MIVIRISCRPDGLPLDRDGVSGTFDGLHSGRACLASSSTSSAHTASLMLANGSPAKVVQERLGHSSVMGTLDIYSHVAPGLQRDATDQLARAIDG